MWSKSLGFKGGGMPRSTLAGDFRKHGSMVSMENVCQAIVVFGNGDHVNLSLEVAIVTSDLRV